VKVLDPGHTYLLDELDFEEVEQQYDSSGNPLWEPGCRLWFVKRIGEGYPGNVGPARAGTTTQEVIRALIDRTRYVDGQKKDWRNGEVVRCLQEALSYLEMRALHQRHGDDADRVMYDTEHFWSVPPELWPVCQKCGHTFCEETCR
jgi:hypothetical protein